MFKRSLLTAAILGALVAAAGAHSEGEVERARALRTPQLELPLEASPAACWAGAAETQSEAVLESLLEQTSPQLEESETPKAYAWSWRSVRPRRCIMCTYYL